MINNNDALDKEYEEYLLYLYELSARKYGDHPDTDSLIQETILTLIARRNRRIAVEHPKGFLSAVMKNKYNRWLREKYRNRVVSYECDMEDADALTSDEDEVKCAEYESIRRELGRLMRIYREVAVRHYVHGHPVERIAADLNISTGTVKSRLSTAREQIREGLNNVEKYAKISYEPKSISLGIWGYGGMSGEPFSLLHSDIEANILALAYEKPVRIREIADSMGIPTAYVEPLVDALIRGELMGRTDGGLVFTRCFMQRYEDAFGDVEGQEAMADTYARQVWDVVWRHVEPLTARQEFDAMSQKQKATLLLFVINQALSEVIYRSNPGKVSAELPERPNGGKWLALATVFEHGQKRNFKYEKSGPVQVHYRKNQADTLTCKMYDLHSLFGAAHSSYGEFKYRCTLRDVLQFYASLLPCDVEAPKSIMLELIPEFERLGILTRKDSGEIALDIPALSFDEARLYHVAIEKIQEELYPLLSNSLSMLWNRQGRRVPKHVDEYQCFENEGKLGSYLIAQMLSIVEKGLLPYPVTVGKTPIILVEYQKRK